MHSGNKHNYSRSIVTASRAINTVYQNTTGKEIIIIATFYVTNDDVIFEVDATNPPTTEVARSGGGGSRHSTTIAFVPNNWFYRARRPGTGSGSVTVWVELT